MQTLICLCRSRLQTRLLDLLQPVTHATFTPFVSEQAPNLTLWVSNGQPLHLVSALSDDGSACGDLFWDDGESIDTYETGQYAYIVFSVAQVLTLAWFRF